MDCCDLLRSAAICCDLLRSAAICCDLLPPAGICWDLLQHAAICHDLPRSVTVCHDLPRFAGICCDLPRSAAIFRERMGVFAGLCSWAYGSPTSPRADLTRSERRAGGRSRWQHLRRAVQAWCYRHRLNLDFKLRGCCWRCLRWPCAGHVICGLDSEGRRGAAKYDARVASGMYGPWAICTVLYGTTYEPACCRS